MFIVVLFLFNGWRQTIIIWLAVPLALIGVIYGLAGTQIADGKARMAAVVDAAVSPVRPVSLGVLTTVLGVVPLLWDPFFKSLAVVIICGLSFATILALIVVPALYAIFFRVRQEETAEG